MNKLWFLLPLFFMAGCASVDHAPPAKVALIIGNSHYQHASTIPNPANDATDLAARLRDLGFWVVEGVDLDRSALQLKVADFAAALQQAEIGLFFYAGHGIQIDGVNYMVPVETQFDGAGDGGSALMAQVFPLDHVLQIMSSPHRTSLVFLDACRNNPMVEELASSAASRGIVIKQTSDSGEVSSRDATIHRGLAEISAGSSRNMFIAYATQPGNVAMDGTGRNSPFTTSLLANIATPGLEVRQLLTEVRRDVMQKTGGSQVPWDHASLTTQFFFKKKIQTTLPPP